MIVPKITDEYNNPFDKDAPRTKRFAIAVNDYDLYEIAFRAKQGKTKMSKTEFARYSMNLPLDVKIGASKGNQNAKKKERKAD